MKRPSALHALNWFQDGEIRFDGYFGGSYSVRVRPVTAEAQWGFVFAGQGAAHPGMFRDQYRRPEIRALFGRADRLAADLGLPSISAHVRAPEGADPAPLIPIQNLSLFTLEVAQFDSLLCRGIFPRSLTSHSFGEYAMLVAAGVLPFEEMFRIVAHREKISPPPNSRGFLIAVGADRDRTARVLQGRKAYLSNFNSPSQTVVAVPPEEADAVEKVCQTHGLKCKRLATLQPYHSPLLLSLKPLMRKFLKSGSWTLRPPSVPLFSSVAKKWIDGASFQAEDILQILESQVVEPVDFIRQVRALADAGTTRLMEIGPTSLLGPLARDCGARETAWVGDLLRKTERKKSAAKLSRPVGKVMGIVNEVIGAITGYKIEEISLEDRFQEDLGIDSIKKTEILFTVMDRLNYRPESELNYSRFTKVEDLVGFLEAEGLSGTTARVEDKIARFGRYQVGWKEAPPDPVWSRGVQSSPLMIPLRPEDFVDSFDVPRLAEEFVGQIKEYGSRQVILVATGFSNDVSFTADGTLNRWIDNGLPCAAAFVRAVLQLDPSLASLSVGLVTTGRGNVLPEAIAAFFKSLRKETPEFRFKHIRLDEDDPKVEALRWIRDELRQPLDSEVRYAEGVRYVPEFRSVPDAEKTPELAPDAVVVAVGGAKGITLSLLERIPGVKVLHLCGRSSETEVAPQLEALRAKGIAVEYAAVDATRAEEIAPFLENILETHGRIDLLLHAAGVEVSRSFLSKDDAEIRRELAAKALSAAHVVRAVGAQPPKRLVFFSSVVSWFGNSGQTIYAAANAILDRLCAELNSAWGAGTAASVLWPPWDGVGMTANRAIREGLRQKGLSLLGPDRAAELFVQDLEGTEGRVLYFDPSDADAYGMPLEFGFPTVLGAPHFGPGGVRFSRPLNQTTDPYLDDHRIDGLPYLPAATGVAASLAALYVHHRRWVGLGEFVAKTPIVVGEKGTTLTLDVKASPEGTVLRVGTDLGSFVARGAIDEARPGPAEASVVPSSIVEARRIYGPAGLFHGPRLRTLSRLEIGAGGTASSLFDSRTVPPLGWGGFWGRLVQWIDTAFQMTAIVELERSGAYCLPVRVSGVVPSFTGPLPDVMRFSLDRFRSQGENIRSDVAVFDEDGHCWLRLSGIEMKIVRRSAGAPSASASR